MAKPDLLESPETDLRHELDRPWQVVVHNDPVKGRSVVWSGDREKAELYVQQLHGFLLLATMEKAS